MLPVDDIPEDFGHWFAGFTDGEGCFDIHPIHNSTGGSYICRFAIGLRADDVEILRYCQQTLGIGEVVFHGQRGNQNPQARWNVARKREVAYLVSVFDRYPLRAKKRRDVAIWKEAVSLWLAVTTRSRKHDWSAIAMLREELSGGKAYAHDDTEHRLAESPQLRLVA